MLGGTGSQRPREANTGSARAVQASTGPLIPGRSTSQGQRAGQSPLAAALTGPGGQQGAWGGGRGPAQAPGPLRPPSRATRCGFLPAQQPEQGQLRAVPLCRKLHTADRMCDRILSLLRFPLGEENTPKTPTAVTSGD